MSQEPTAKIIRLYCDGELPAQEHAELEQQMDAEPACRARVEFERQLRQRVATIMQTQCACAPPELADRIRSRLDEAATEDHTTPLADMADGRPPATQAPGFSIASWIRGPRRANVFAVAASLALVGGAVLFGIFGRPIDNWGRPHPTDLAATAAPFVAKEHVRCADSATIRSNKATFRDPYEAGVELSEWLGTRVKAVPLADDLHNAGWTFFGGGHCGVPTAERSGHLIFIREDPAPEPVMLSIFVVPDNGLYAVRQNGSPVPVQPHQWYELPAGRLFAREVRLYSDGDVLYLMVACVPDELPNAASALERTLRRAGD